MTKPELPNLEGKTFPASGGQYKVGKYLGGKDEAVVHMGRYKDMIDCVLKFVGSAPRIPAEQLGPVLRNEVFLLSNLRHTNITKILDFGLAHFGSSSYDDIGTLREPPLTYIAMDFVRGENLSNVWARIHPEEFLDILDQLLDAVEYLEQRGVLHIDIKPSNIMVEPIIESDHKRYHAVLIDLGFSVVADPSRFKQFFSGISADRLTDEDTVYVYFDEDYAEIDEVRELRGKKVLRREVRSRMFPQHDLYSLGCVIDEFLKVKSEAKENDNLASRHGVDLVEGLATISQRLKTAHYLDEEFAGSVPASLVREDVLKLKSGYVYPFGVPELASASSDGISLGLSQVTVPLTRRVVRLIDHPYFQRLRAVPQLEYVSLLYPDANHTRFSHSILTFHLTRLTLLNLLTNIKFRLSVNADDLQATLLIALLHDIGHYPLSHMFEDFKGRPTSGSGDPVLTDDELFLTVVGLEEKSDLATQLRKERERRGEKTLAELVKENFGLSTFEALRSISGLIYAGEAPTKAIHRFLAAMISSPLDLDKAAYLSLDSHMTGVPYGQGVDLGYYMRSFEMPQELGRGDSTDADASFQPVLGINPKGLAAAESLILSRYWMLSRVYWWHTNRAVQAALKFVIGQLILNGRLSFTEYFVKSFRLSDVEAAKYLSEKFDDLNKEQGSKMVNPVRELLEYNRAVYKRLLVISSGRGKDAVFYRQLIEKDEMAVTQKLTTVLGKYIKNKGLDNGLAEFFTPDGSLKLGALLFDIPRKARDVLDLDKVRVEGSSTEGLKGSRKLDTESQLLKQLSKEFLDQVKKCRIFVHPRIQEALGRAGVLEDVMENMRSQIADLLR